MVFGRKRETAAAPAPPPPPRAAPSGRAAGRARERENERAIRSAQRDFGRERMRLEAEEARMLADIKRLAKEGRVAEAKSMSRSLVQLREMKARTGAASVQVGSVGNQAKLMGINGRMVEIMGGTTAVMANANGGANPEQQMKMAQEFMMQSEKMSLAQEMTDDALEGIMGGDEATAEGDEVLQGVLDEIGLDFSARVGAAPSLQPAQSKLQEQQEAARTQAAHEEQDILNRIAKLQGL